MLFTCGPPCRPGKTAVSSRFAISGSVVITTAPRGPQSVLCVVNVITCACGSGLLSTPAATMPARCAMSARRYAPTSSAISRSAAQSKSHGYADAPPMMMRGLRLARPLADSRVVEPPRALLDPVGMDLVSFPGEIEDRAVRQVAAVRKVEPHHALARLQERLVHRLVRRRAGERLDVHVNFFRARASVQRREDLRDGAMRDQLHAVRVDGPLVIAPVREPRLPGLEERLIAGRPARIVAEHRLRQPLGVDRAEFPVKHLSRGRMADALGRDHNQPPPLPLALSLGDAEECPTLCRPEFRRKENWASWPT